MTEDSLERPRVVLSKRVVDKLVDEVNRLHQQYEESSRARAQVIVLSVAIIALVGAATEKHSHLGPVLVPLLLTAVVGHAFHVSLQMVETESIRDRLISDVNMQLKYDLFDNWTREHRRTRLAELTWATGPTVVYLGSVGFGLVENWGEDLWFGLQLAVTALAVGTLVASVVAYRGLEKNIGAQASYRAHTTRRTEVATDEEVPASRR